MVVLHNGVDISANQDETIRQGTAQADQDKTTDQQHHQQAANGHDSRGPTFGFCAPKAGQGPPQVAAQPSAPPATPPGLQDEHASLDAMPLYCTWSHVFLTVVQHTLP